MKQVNKKAVGRPKIDAELKVKFKTLPVICSPEEYEAVVLIARNLKYKSLSALLRSAISKGIFASAENGLFTSPTNKIHWQYWMHNWNLTKHLEENTDHILFMDKVKESVEIVKKKNPNVFINKVKKGVDN
jgi:hypothetical protein